jgi:hypothetical protein
MDLLFIFNPKPNLRFKDGFVFALGCLTVCVSGLWAGRDSLREQKKLQARKMLENAAESHKSTARFVRQPYGTPDSIAMKRLCGNFDKIFTYN